MENSTFNYKDLVSCQVHKCSSILMNQHFSIYCSKCGENRKENLVMIDSQNSTESLNIRQCYTHNGKEGTFFCGTCNEFVCSICITDVHRKHKSGIPEDHRDIIISELSKLDKLLDNSSANLAKEARAFSFIFNTLHNEEDEVLENNKSITRRIKDKIENKAIELESRALTQLELFEETEASNMFVISLSSVRRINEFFNVLPKLSSIVHRGFVTHEEKSRKANFLNIKNKIDSLEDIIHKFPNVISQETSVTQKIFSSLIEEKLSKLEDANNKINECGGLMEAVNQSLYSGAFPRPYFLRRFISFFNSGLIYFKNSSIIFENKGKQSIGLLGVGICGLTASKDNGLCRFRLTISQINSLNPIVLFDEEILVKEIEETNARNPVQLIYFQKYVSDVCSSVIQIKVNSKYKIKLENLESNQYLSLWNGKTISRDFASMFKEKKTSYLTQEVHCNSTGSIFKFYSSEMTDLNEFSNGLICDLIFSENY